MGPIIRDIIILVVLTFLGGFVAGFARGQSSDAQFGLAIAVSNLIFEIVGFTISGCLAPPGRWRHLALVALGAWLVSIFNVVFFNVNIVLWMASVVTMAATMGIGGAISYLFKRDVTPSQ
jgi:hypothetical protein